MVPRFWSNTSKNIVIKVFFRCDYHLNQEPLSKADYPPLRWIGLIQWGEGLKKKDWGFQGREEVYLQMPSDSAFNINSTQELLQISVLPVRTTVLANSVSLRTLMQQNSVSQCVINLTLKKKKKLHIHGSIIFNIYNS